jgi:eukaryotic-like serine/threonine-protein kinase
VTVRAPRFGRFELLARIGTGGAGEVLLVEDDGRRLALKRLLPHLDGAGAADGFAREGALAAQLVHRNVVRVLEHGHVGTTPYVLMELVDGTSLHRLVRAAERLPPAAAAFIARELCHALEYLHGLTDGDGRPLALVHRDVTPSNVLVSRSGEVKLCDFGIAKATAGTTTTRTAPGLIKGKPGYRAPEQEERTAFDRRSDVYAIGVVLFEMIAGRRPLSDDERLGDGEAALDAICARARATDPELRFASAAEMAAALDAAGAVEGAAALRAGLPRWCPPPLATEPTHTRTRTLARADGAHRWSPLTLTAAVVAAVAVVIVVTVAAFGWSRHAGRPVPAVTTPTPTPTIASPSLPAAAQPLPAAPAPSPAPPPAVDARPARAHAKPKRPRRATSSDQGSDYMPDPFHR